MGSSLLFPLNQFFRMHRPRVSQLNVTEAQVKREIAAMWTIIMNYEAQNDIPTIQDEDSYYYGNLDDYERERLHAMRSPSRSVAFLIFFVDDDFRSIERDIAEMRRLVVKFSNTEEWIVIGTLKNICWKWKENNKMKNKKEKNLKNIY